MVPPKAAEVVALSKVSELTMPAADSCSIWAWRRRRRAAPACPFASISSGALRKVATDGCDRSTLDADIGVELVDSSDNPPSADHPIERGLWHLSYSPAGYGRFALDCGRHRPQE